LWHADLHHCQCKLPAARGRLVAPPLCVADQLALKNELMRTSGFGLNFTGADTLNGVN